MLAKDEEAAFARHGRTAPAGTLLFTEGDAGAEMFVIQTGRIELTRRILGQTHVVASLTAGEFFGEMAILNNRPRTASARVVEEARLIVLDATALETMVRESSEIAVRLLKKLSLRFDTATAYIEKLMVKDARQRVIETLGRLIDELGQPEAGGAIVLPLTAATLADKAGVPTIQAAEVLADLKLTGVITDAKPGPGAVRRISVSDRSQIARPPSDRLAAAMKTFTASTGAASVMANGSCFESAGVIDADATGAMIAILAPALQRAGEQVGLGELVAAGFCYQAGALHLVRGADGYLTVIGKPDRTPEITLGKLYTLLAPR